MQTAGCIFQGDVRTKVKTPHTGKKRLCKLHYIPVQGSCLVSYKLGFIKNIKLLLFERYHEENEETNRLGEYIYSTYI
jgi:hypothetical protein